MTVGAQQQSPMHVQPLWELCPGVVWCAASSFAVPPDTSAIPCMPAIAAIWMARSPCAGQVCSAIGTDNATASHRPHMAVTTRDRADRCIPEST